MSDIDGRNPEPQCNDRYCINQTAYPHSHIYSQVKPA